MSVVNVVRCAANAAVAAKVKTVATNDESELDFLQEKPSVGRKTGSKARRHAYLKFMIKQGKSDLFMEKELVNDSKLSKKRRGKVLSSLNDDFDLSVPYSINRKGRWENVNSAADLVAAANESDDVLVTGADGRYGMSWFTNGDATGYHELAADGTVRSKYSKGVSGTSLASLKASLTPCESRKSRRRSKRLAFAKIVPEDEVKSQEDEVKPQIRYVISKPHSVPMCYGGSMYKKDPYDDWSRSRHNNKKIDLEDADCRCDDVEQEEPEVDMTASMAALYRAPKQSTFSLGDFIKDSPAVLISSKSIESIADFEKTEPVDDLKKEMPSCSTNAVVDEQKLCKNAVFLEVEVEKAKFCGTGPLVGTFGTLESQKELRFRWLTDDKTRCCFDLTKKLDEHTTKMALMVVIEELKSKEGYLRVLLNGSFGCPEGVMINLLKEKSYTGAEAFIGLFVEKVQTWYNKTQESKKQLNSLATLNSIFHGHQLAKTVQPSGDYQILAEAAAKAPTVEAIMVDVEEDDDDMDFDEFEVVELDELISEGDEDEKEETADDLEILPDFGAGCDFCDTQNVDELVMLENCGHRFCKRCLRHELTDAIVRNTAYPLTCLHDTCHAAIPLDFLATILPLPLAEYYFRFAFMAENVANGKTVVECPHCKDLAAVDEKPTYGSVKCSVCSISFCFGCQSQPHFPLTCRQMAVWENKFAKQFPVDLGRKNVNGNKQCGCGELLQNEKNQTNVTCSACNVSYIWKTGEPIGRRANKAKPLIAVDLESLPNNIASEFSQICSEARLLRFNLVANRQITKKMCKSVDFRVKQVFIEIRKTVLHLIEFGFAWLYLTRNNKPAIWSSCKSGLTGLRAKLDIIHADIERGQSDGVEAKVAELNGMTQKVLEEFADRG